MSDHKTRTQLRDLLDQKALKRGDFILASGKKSKYYLDCKNVTLDSYGAYLVGLEMLRGLVTNDTYPDAVGGLAIGADPITTAIIMSTAYASMGTVTFEGAILKPISGFMVRKEPKDHGVQSQIVGPLKPGMSVVVVEDVCTTGMSAMKAVKAVEEFGCVVKCVYGIVDRLEGAAENLKKEGYHLLSLFTIRDFGIEPPP